MDNFNKWFHLNFSYFFTHKNIPSDKNGGYSKFVNIIILLPVIAAVYFIAGLSAVFTIGLLILAIYSSVWLTHWIWDINCKKNNKIPNRYFRRAAKAVAGYLTCIVFFAIWVIVDTSLEWYDLWETLGSTFFIAGLLMFFFILYEMKSGIKEKDVLIKTSADNKNEKDGQKMPEIAPAFDVMPESNINAGTNEINTGNLKSSGTAGISKQDTKSDFKPFLGRKWNKAEFYKIMPVAGSYYIANPQKASEEIDIGDFLYLKREPNNPYDENAIMVITKSLTKLGYIPAKYNLIPAQLMDSGKVLIAKLHEKNFDEGHLKLSIELYYIAF